MRSMIKVVSFPENGKILDWALLIFGYPIIACSFMFIANDNPFSYLIQIPTFKTDVVFALIVTYAVGLYLKSLTHRLDRMEQGVNFSARVKLQLVYGVILPLVTAMALEGVYLYWIDIPGNNSSIFNLELPLTLIFLLLINSFYLVVFLHHSKGIQRLEQPVPKSIEPTLVDSFFVRKGYREQKIDVKSCAYIKSSGKILWLCTYDSHQFRLDGTLDEWETRLSPFFFRINRQYLVASNAVTSVEQTATRKLRVCFYCQQEDEIFVSKANVTEFRKWWRRELSILA
jgi:hypothetical protein